MKSISEDPMTRFNRGFYDGMILREAGWLPEWARGESPVDRPAHPFDPMYGEGFWDGWAASEVCARVFAEESYNG